jgi:hypothetical protein
MPEGIGEVFQGRSIKTLRPGDEGGKGREER